MKKFLFLLIAGFCTVQLSGQTINFSVQPLSGESELSAASQEMLQNKLRQIITRNSAGAANDYNVFVIEPVITVLDKQSTSGLMRNTTLVKGELTLVAKNRIDGSMYHSAVVSVSGQAAEGADPYKAMISALRTTDPVYTRFIRIARQKIQDYYAANCATILQKAQSLYNLKKYPEALSYLSAVSESVPCYEQASVLQTELAQYVPDVQPDTVIIQKVIEKPVEVEKLVEVEKIVEKPVVVEKVVEKPVIVEKVVEKPVAQETPAARCEITLSTNRLQFKVLKCTGNATQQRITILAEMTNVDTGRNTDEFLRFTSAFTDSGTECKNFEIQNGAWMKMPPRVTVRREFYVTNVFDRFSLFSYIELLVADTKVYIRNLPVQWQ